jgi:hypothetical protein
VQVPKPAAAAITPDVAGSERLGIQNCDYERKILEELERSSIASVLVRITCLVTANHFAGPEGEVKLIFHNLVLPQAAF